MRSSLKVIITVGELQYEVVQTNSFCYRSLDHDLTPRLSAVSPRHAAAGTVLKLEGANFGEAVEDYTNIYVGKGRPPQGGNIDTGCLLYTSPSPRDS